MTQRATGPAIYLSWMAYNGRSAGMAEGLGIEPVYVYASGPSLPKRYIKQWRMTRTLLRRKKPSTVLVMQPPVFSLLCVWMYSWRSKAKLAADMHTGAFEDPRWKWATCFILRIARRGRNRAIVTNTPLAERARSRGVTTFECHGYLRVFTVPADAAFDDASLEASLPEQFVLVPLAWAYDEPIAHIIEAARQDPSINWVLTGKPESAVVATAPPNVVFPGFVTRADFERLRARASVVAALTTAEDTMQRSGYEALEACTPLVTSPPRVLREYFGDAALYAQPTAASILDSVRTAFEDADIRRGRMSTLLAEKLSEQKSDLALIRAWIDS